MRVAIYKPHPEIKGRWDRQNTPQSIPEIPFLFIQTPRRKDYKEKGCKVIRGFNGNAVSIHANMIPINARLMFSDWKRPDGKLRDIAVLFLGDRIMLYEFPDKSKSIKDRERRVFVYFKKHPVYGGLYQR